MTDKTYKVRIQPSGREVTVKATETVLDGVLRAGLLLPHSCRNGSCGACKGVVLTGSVDYGTYDEKALTADERAAGKALFCQARPTSDLTIEAKEIDAPKGIVIKTLPARVIQLERAAHDVMVLSLKLPQQPEPFKFLAGQYIDILLRSGDRRSFSLANPPHQVDSLELHVRHVPGGRFTGQVFNEMREKDLLRFRGPLGMFFLREDDAERPIILVAGGTGFAPIQSIVQDAIARGLKRPMHLYWGVRAKRDLYRHALAESWCAAYPNFRYTPVLSEPQPEDAWTGRTGWVHDAVLADYADFSGHEVYASGPPPMINAIRAVFFPRGLAEDRLHYDSFEFAHTT
ncbi:MAG: CDP-6-deoxy-delta-3,4-glucoseen reductase [Gammaproteobacteria bacterium]|nr:CDP-6-deoxy-delta-3,4-glucoseen reductase [Gammaproteobacteria bacterium]